MRRGYGFEEWPGKVRRSRRRLVGLIIERWGIVRILAHLGLERTRLRSNSLALPRGGRLEF